MIDLEELKSMMQKPASVNSQEKPSDSVPAFELDDDGEEYMPVGVEGVLASTEKLLAINRGLVDQDERDSLRFQKVFRPHSMLRESIKMDAGKTARTAMYQAAKRRNLKGVNPFMFDSYVERLLVGNPLTSPLEEINPMQLVENARRVTKMGPGGLSSSRSITSESQNVHPSQFGFISPIEGPECYSSDTQVFTQNGWIKWEDANEDTLFATRVNGVFGFHRAGRLIKEHYEGEMIGCKNRTMDFLVTPGHRIISQHVGKPGYQEHVDLAKDIYDKWIYIPTSALPDPGDEEMTTYTLENKETERSVHKLKSHTFDIADWCSLVGWFLSEGSLRINQGKLKAIEITQNSEKNKEDYDAIIALVERMGIPYTLRRENGIPYGIRIWNKSIVHYFSKYDEGCYNKWIPEELFDAPIYARQALLDSLVAGDGRNYNMAEHGRNMFSYSTTSSLLASGVERLIFSLGYGATVTTTQTKYKGGKLLYTITRMTTKLKATITSQTNGWYKTPYSGMVYCASVPGKQLLVKRGKGHPIWSGNSERAGIDVRVAWGAKLGSNGRLYQKFYDRRKKRFRWLSPEDLDGLTVKIPD